MNSKGNPQNLKKIPKGVSGNPKGRPKRTYGVVLDELKKKGYKPPLKEEFFNVVGMLMTMTEEDLEEFAKDKEKPYWIRLLIQDLNRSKTRERIMSDYRDWIFGKAKESVDHTSKGEGVGNIQVEIVNPQNDANSEKEDPSEGF